MAFQIFRQVQTTATTISQLILDESDQTKNLNFDATASASSTSTVLALTSTEDRTINFPDVSGTLVTSSSAETLTNKKLRNPVLLDFSDPSKSCTFQFDQSSPNTQTIVVFSSSEDRVFYVPDAVGDDTFAMTNFNQFLANKRLDVASTDFGVLGNDKTVRFNTDDATDPSDLILKSKCTSSRDIYFPDASGTLLIDSVPATFASGSEAAPSITFADGTDCGFSRSTDGDRSDVGLSVDGDFIANFIGAPTGGRPSIQLNATVSNSGELIHSRRTTSTRPVLDSTATPINSFPTLIKQVIIGHSGGIYTIPNFVGYGGTFLAIADVSFSASAVGSRQAYFTINGTSVPYYGYASVSANSATLPTRFTIQAIVFLESGDTIRLNVFQDSGTTLTFPATVSATDICSFTVMKLG